MAMVHTARTCGTSGPTQRGIVGGVMAKALLDRKPNNQTCFLNAVGQGGHPSPTANGGLIMDMKEYLKRKCANCGCTFGSHHGGTQPWPRDYCPGNEGQMDWENGPGTTFKEESSALRGTNENITKKI